MARNTNKFGDPETPETPFDDYENDDKVITKETKKTALDIKDPYGNATVNRKTRGLRIEEDLYFIMDILKDRASKRGERDFLSNLVNKLLAEEFNENGLLNDPNIVQNLEQRSIRVERHFDKKGKLIKG